MEVGPGDCALALAVAARVKTVYAVDVTDALLGEQETPHNFHFVHSNGVSVPVPRESIDLAYSSQVMEHLHPEDVGDHLCGIRDALAPGGRLICITPNRISGPWDVSRHFDESPRGLHLREYTISELADLLRSVGFEVRLFASYKGYRFLSAVPERFVRMFEASLVPRPTHVRRRLASPLAAVKVVATKPTTG
jgi:SAM-dependent methyltransferase